MERRQGRDFFHARYFYCTVERHLVTLRNDCWLVKFLFNICDSKFFKYTMQGAFILFFYLTSPVFKHSLIQRKLKWFEEFIHKVHVASCGSFISPG